MHPKAKLQQVDQQALNNNDSIQKLQIDLEECRNENVALHDQVGRIGESKENEKAETIRQYQEEAL